MSTQHTPGPWHYTEVPGGEYEIRVANGAWLLRLASASDPTEEQHQEDEANVRLAAASPELLAIAERLSLATNEGDDAAQGTHYVDKQGVIRCKGSFLALIEDARAAIAKAGAST
jgi:hypothetical protein